MAGIFGAAPKGGPRGSFFGGAASQGAFQPPGERELARRLEEFAKAVAQLESKLTGLEPKRKDLEGLMAQLYKEATAVQTALTGLLQSVAEQVRAAESARANLGRECLAAQSKLAELRAELAKVGDLREMVRVEGLSAQLKALEHVEEQYREVVGVKARMRQAEGEILSLSRNAPTLAWCVELERRLKELEKRSAPTRPASGGVRGAATKTDRPWSRILPGTAGMLLAFLTPSLLFAADEMLPLDNKSRFEEVLEKKGEEVLERILGQGQAKIIIDATLDFSRTEKIQIAGAAQGKDGGLFLWQTARKAEEARFPQVLPGYVAPQAEAPGAFGNQNYERQIVYPKGLVQKLIVTAILNENLEEEAIQRARGILTRLYDLQDARGDVLQMLKAPFPSVWSSALSSSEFANSFIRYAVLLLGLVIVGYCLLQLAGAITSAANVQTGLPLDLPRLHGGSGEMTLRTIHEGGGPDEEDEEGGVGPASPRATPSPQGEGQPAPAGEIVFQVRPDQVAPLAQMLQGEDPYNIAIVVSFLPQALRQPFLDGMPKDVSTRVFLNLSSINYVDPDTLATMKEELERRLTGVFGGPEEVGRLLQGLDSDTQKVLLTELNRQNAPLAQELRKKTLFLEDLARLSERDWMVLVPNLTLLDWALVLSDGLSGFSPMVQRQLPPRSWKMVEQLKARGRQSAQKLKEARTRLLKTAWKLIQEGKIENPLAPRLDFRKPAEEEVQARGAPAEMRLRPM